MMQCPRCGKDNPEGRTLCLSCWAPLTATPPAGQTQPVPTQQPGPPVPGPAPGPEVPYAMPRMVEKPSSRRPRTALWVAAGLTVVVVVAFLLGLYGWMYGFESAQTIFAKMYDRLDKAQTIEGKLEGAEGLIPVPGVGGGAVSFAVQKPHKFWAQMSATGTGLQTIMCDGSAVYAHESQSGLYMKMPFSADIIKQMTADYPAPEQVAAGAVTLRKRQCQTVRGQRVYVIEATQKGETGLMFISRSTHLPLALEMAQEKQRARIEVVELKLDEPLDPSIQFAPPPGTQVTDLMEFMKQGLQGMGPFMGEQFPGGMPQMPQGMPFQFTPP